MAGFTDKSRILGLGLDKPNPNPNPNPNPRRGPQPAHRRARETNERRRRKRTRAAAGSKRKLRACVGADADASSRRERRCVLMNNKPGGRVYSYVSRRRVAVPRKATNVGMTTYSKVTKYCTSARSVTETVFRIEAGGAHRSSAPTHF